MARSSARAGTWHQLIRRVRRLVGPMWVYGIGVWCLSTAMNASSSPLWVFLFPFVQPRSDIAGVWFTSALWYLTAYWWVLLLSPLLMGAVRKTGALAPAILSCSVMVVGVLGLDESHTGWIVGDILLYTGFAMWGMALLAGERPEPRTLRVPTVCLLVATLGWLAVRTGRSPVVNDDHILHMLLGGTWTLALLQAPSLMSSIARSLPARFLNEHPLTVYLWHPALAWLMWQLVPHRVPGQLRTIVVVGTTFSLLPVVTYGIGWVERRGTLSRKAFTPRVLAICAATVLLTTGPVTSRVDLFRGASDVPLPPSAAPRVVRIEPRREVTDFLAKSSPTNDQRIFELKSITEHFDSELGLGGTRVTVTTKEGHVWQVSVGTRPKSPSERSQIGSITKTFTATLVMQLVEEGKLSLDQAIGDLGMGFSHGRITLRQLLGHTSGVPAYDASSGLLEDGTTPSDVVRWASSRPLEFKPGSRVKYSTTGFVLIGVLLERITGERFEDLVRRRITDTLGYDIAFFRGRYRSAGFSTGGISMNPADLADWTRRYFRDRSLTSTPWQWDIRVTTGIGVHGYCPCEKGSFMAIGHMGGRTFTTVDGDGIVVVIDSRGVLVNENYSQVQQLAQELRLVAGGGRTFVYP